MRRTLLSECRRAWLAVCSSDASHQPPDSFHERWQGRTRRLHESLALTVPDETARLGFVVAVPRPALYRSKGIAGRRESASRKSDNGMLGRVIPALLAVALLGTCAAASRAQSGSTGAALTGLVLDQTDARLPAANLTVTNDGTNAQRVVISGDDGRYLVPALPPGTYTVTAQYAGFASQTR